MQMPTHFSWLRGLLGGMLVLAPFSVPPATGQTCAPVPAGVVSWWTLGGSGIDNEGYNSAGLFGGQFVPGELGTSFLINAAGDYGRVGASPSLNVGLGAGFTIDMWVNPDDTSVEHPFAEWNTGLRFQSHFWHSVDAPGDLFTNILSSDGTEHAYSSNPGLVLVNVWQHVAVTYDKASGVSKLYLNGAVVAQQNLGSFIPSTTADLYFGLRPSTGQYYKGQLDEIDLFSRALSDLEVKSIFRAGMAGKCSSLLVPISLDFGSQTANTVSAAQAVTFTNQTRTALHVLISASGPFAETDTCGRILPAGGTCSIGVTFTPVATGTQSGHVSVLTNASHSPKTIRLIGTGT